MNANVTREGNEATLKISVSAKEVDKSFKQAVARIAGQVKIPGFRPGKAPRNIIEMHYGKGAVKEEAFNICVNRAYQEAVEAEKLMPVSDPQVLDEKKAFEGGFFSVLACQIENVVILYCSIVKMGNCFAP